MRQDGNWMPLIFYFFIASSVMGVISSVVVVWFGLPYTWSYGIMMIPLLGGMFLLYRGYSPLAWGVMACIGFILLSGVSLARAFLISEPPVPDNLKAYMDAEDSVSDPYGDAYGYYATDNVIGADADKALIVSYGYEFDLRTPVTIQFPSLRTLGGQWAFAGGMLKAQGALNGTFQGEAEYNWLQAEEAEFEDDLPSLPADPYLTVMLPIAPIHNGKQITFTAQLEITYPTEDGIETKTLTRRVDALVASDDYYLYATQYDDWQRARKVVETPLWIVLVVGSIAAVGGSVALIRRGAFQVVSTGSLIIEIRRQSGARRLGVEAHSLKKVDVDIDPSIERGVILGLVHAQSPAGRGGLRSGDVLVSLNDKAINSPGDLNRVAGRIKKGQSIPVTVLRDGEEIKLTIKF